MFCTDKRNWLLVVEPKGYAINGGKYCGIFAQSKNCGVRETAVARERLCKHARY
jgi:hypothetical protein